MKLNVGFIGAVGVPNNYGGFEMFLESCAPLLGKLVGKVYVTCDRSRYENRDKQWGTVERVFIPVPANGPMSVLHDLLAFLAVFSRVQAIIVLGVSGGLFFPFFRLACALFGKKLIVNVDGVEWRRAKFSNSRRAFLYISDRMAQLCAHRVVVDNEGLRPYLVQSVQRDASLIAYSGDHVLRKPVPREPGANCLTICRVEPENNCDLLIEAFARFGGGTYTFVGNWNASEYGRGLRVRFGAVPGLQMLDPIYDKNVLCRMRESCNVYLHGHSVGGTNPSLVEMLFYDCQVIAFDCVFNRHTAGEAIQYFADPADLAERLAADTAEVAADRAALRLQYTAERIAGAYASLVRGLFGLQHERAEALNQALLEDEAVPELE